MVTRPASLRTVPQDTEVEVTVRNLGRDEATATIALFESQTNVPSHRVAERPLTVAGRAAVKTVFTVTTSDAGDRTFQAMADPEGAVAETREDNNDGAVVLPDLHNTVDLSLIHI